MYGGERGEGAGDWADLLIEYLYIFFFFCIFLHRPLLTRNYNVLYYVVVVVPGIRQRVNTI